MDAKPPLLVGPLAALTASLCCVMPRVLVMLGVGSTWVSTLSQFEPLRPVFIATALVMLFLAWRKLYQPASCAPDKICADLQLQRGQRVAFWLVSALILVLQAFPWFAPLFYEGRLMNKPSLLLLAFAVVSAPTFAAIQTVTLVVPDMNCAVCPITVKKALLKVKGVKTVQVEFDHRLATVTYDDAQTTITVLTKATTEAGYPSSVVVKK